MRNSFGVRGILVVGIVLLCVSSYAERPLKTPIKLKFAIGGHSVSTTTLDSTFLIHHVEENVTNKDSQSGAQETRDEMEHVYIHIEGRIVPNGHRRNSYSIHVEGRIEMEFTSNRSTDLFVERTKIPDASGSKSTHERREMELRASTRMKAGQKKTLASKDGFDVELRIEEDTD